jgi:hypothetical protein
MNEPDTYPVGTNKVLFVAFGTIPNVSPKPDRVPISPPSVPKLVGNVVTPVYASKVEAVVDPIIQTALSASNPTIPAEVPLDVKSVVLNEPEPFHTTSGPTCETVILKLLVAADVGVGVGVSVGVSVFVGVTAGVPVGVSVGVGVGVSVSVGVFVGVSAGVPVGVGVGVLVFVGVCVGVVFGNCGKLQKV